MPSLPDRRLTAQDFHPAVLSLFDRYVHGLIDRRGFLEGASRISSRGLATAGLSAAALLDALNPRFAQAQQVRADDARIRSEFVEIDSPQGYGKLRALLVRPAQASGPLPLVLVVHENRGLNPHIADVARRLATENFIALAPDALFPLGGYPGDEDKARELFPKLEQKKTQEDFVAAAHWLRRLPGGNGKLGVVGFCYGGGMSNLLATRVPEVLAAAPFYGAAPPPDRAVQIKARLFIVYADNDERINAMWPAYQAALDAAKVPYEMQKFPGTQHGFHNDTTPRFEPTAARQAWAKTLALFNASLRG